jgi:hypothetical protein
MDDAGQKHDEDLLHCVPPQHLRNALTLLRSRGADDVDHATAAARNPCHVVVFDRLDPCGGGRPFLASAYNRKGHRYRSPWDNAFHAKDEHGGGDASSTSSIDGADKTSLSRPLRNLEITFNEVWEAYTALYYGHEAVGSVYLKPMAKHGSFEGWFGIQTVCPPAGSSWNSASHVVVEAAPAWSSAPADNDDDAGGQEFTYRVETTVQCILLLQPDMDALDRSSVGAIVSKTCQRTRTLSKTVPVSVGHIETVGDMIESNEIDLRSNLEQVLIPKNQDAIESLLAKQQIGVHGALNPIMSMMMNSEIFKGRLVEQPQQQQQQ